MKPVDHQQATGWPSMIQVPSGMIRSSMAQVQSSQALPDPVVAGSSFHCLLDHLLFVLVKCGCSALAATDDDLRIACTLAWPGQVV